MLKNQLSNKLENSIFFLQKCSVQNKMVANWLNSHWSKGCKLPGENYFIVLRCKYSVQQEKV